MPTAKMVTNWLQRLPEFRAMYVEACRRREVGLWCERDMVIDRAIDQGLAFDRRGDAEIAAIEGRIGRLTPKLYRHGGGGVARNRVLTRPLAPDATKHILPPAVTGPNANGTSPQGRPPSPSAGEHHVS